MKDAGEDVTVIAQKKSPVMAAAQQAGDCLWPGSMAACRWLLLLRQARSSGGVPAGSPLIIVEERCLR